MTDVTEAVAQDAIAESLLGDQPTQETTEQTPTGTEAVDTEQVEQPNVQETEQLSDQEDTEDWLPSDQDKVYPEDVMLRYAQRFGLSEEHLQNEAIRNLLHGKISTDVYLRQLNEQQQEMEIAEPESEPTRQDPQQPPTFEQHIQGLSQWAQQNTDPRIAQKFADDFLQAFGVTDEKGNPAKASPEVAQRLTGTIATFGLNLMQTALPQMLMPMLENVMPGIGGMFYTGARASAWDSVRNSSPQYAGLPAYGSKEFMELCSRLDQEFPALTEMGYALERSNGGQLHGAAAQKFYSTMAKLATKQAVDPQLLQQAAQAGARNARRGEIRKQAGNLGAGKSNGLQNKSAQGSQFQTNSDLFDADTMALYNREHGRL